MKKTLLFILTLFILQPLYSQNVKIKFIETSDIHGQLFPYDFINDKPSNHSLAQIYSYVKEERAKEDQHVVLLDDGDILQGQPDVYYYNFVRPDTTHILASMMNFMGYDAAAVGNHDIEAGHPVYDKLADEFDFPWMAANAVSDSTGEPYFQPYKIIEVEGIKIAVLGMITPHIPHWLPEKIWYGMHYEDMIECAEKWVKIIKEKENPDLMVGLFHAGVDYKYGNVDENTYKNENASVLVAEKVKGFDIVFVGHDHHGWNEFVPDNFGDSVLIVGTKAYAANIGEAVVNLTFDKDSGKWKTDNISGNLIPTESYEPDEEFMQKFGYAERQTKEYVSKPIGELTEAISAKDAIFGDAAFTDVINNIQLKLSGADVSFAAPLSFGAGIDKGTIYVRDMFDLYKYENLLYTMKLTGQEIKDYLEFTSSIWFNQMKDKDDDLLNFAKDDNGNVVYSSGNVPKLKAPYYNFDAAEGIDYIIDVSKSEGERVTITGFSNGSPFDLSATYKVAINSYRGNGGGGHLIQGAGLSHDELTNRIITSTERDLRFYMIQWIEEQKVITPETTHNWKIVPEEWYEAGREKDSKLLFNHGTME